MNVALNTLSLVRAMTASLRALFGRDEVSPSLEALASSFASAARDLSPQARALFERVVAVIAERAPTAAHETVGTVSFAHALAHLCAACDGVVVRTPESFVPTASGAFSALARHLLCEHPVPRFLDNAFAEPLGSPSYALFVHVARGGSWRTADIPWLLTRKAAHVLSTWSEPTTPIARALRSAQLQALHAPAHVVEAVLSTSLAHGAVKAHEAAWLDVFSWLARQPERPAQTIALVIEDIAVRRRAGEAFSVKGRTLDATARVVERKVRDEERFAPARAAGAFPVAAVAGGDVVVQHELDGAVTQVRFRVRQLADGVALATESQRMRNCVVNYVEELRAGEKLLFSMARVLPDGTEKRAVTFELDTSTHDVIEARGVLNRDLEELEKAALAEFARMRTITVAL